MPGMSRANKWAIWDVEHPADNLIFHYNPTTVSWTSDMVLKDGPAGAGGVSVVYFQAIRPRVVRFTLFLNDQIFPGTGDVGITDRVFVDQAIEWLRAHQFPLSSLDRALLADELGRAGYVTTATAPSALTARDPDLANRGFVIPRVMFSWIDQMVCVISGMEVRGIMYGTPMQVRQQLAQQPYPSAEEAPIQYLFGQELLKTRTLRAEVDLTLTEVLDADFVPPPKSAGQQGPPSENLEEPEGDSEPPP